MAEDTITQASNELYKVSISKQELSILPVATYTGKIVLIDNETEALKAIDVLSRESIIGFDTETKPSFKKGQSNNVALLQLSTHDTCYLFRINIIGLLNGILSILEDESILKVGVSIHDDFHNLHKLYNLNPGGFIDLQSYVKDYDILDNSLSKIYAILFGKRISKGQRLTNWEAHTLTIHQQEYASLDAYACIQIYEYLQTNGFTASSSPYYKPIDVINPPQQHKITNE